MARIVRLPLAKQDALSIWLYIGRDNVAAAQRMLETIDSRLELLSRNPKLGRERPDIAPGVRYLPVGKYLILYRPLADGIEVVRLVHGARDLSALEMD